MTLNQTHKGSYKGVPKGRQILQTHPGRHLGTDNSKMSKWEKELTTTDSESELEETLNMV